jgi:transposase
MFKSPTSRKIVDCIVKDAEIFVGLEDSKKTWKVCVRFEKQIVNEASMPAKYPVLQAYLRNNFPGCRVHLVYEAGFKGFNLYDALTADGHHCIVVPPHTVHQEKCARVKNDRIDAKLLAKNLENGDCKACRVPDKELRADRQVVRTLRSVKDKCIGIKNEIRRFFEFHDIETGIEAKEWNDGHYKYLRTLEFAPELRLMLTVYLDILDCFWGKEKWLKAKLKEIRQKKRYEAAITRAASIPGIGELTATRVVLELGEDFGRFKSGAAIASFVGLGGTEYSTGDSIRRGGITKQGNARIRAWLIQCAWMGIRRDPALMNFYLRIKHNSGVAQKAITAVARKMIIRMRSCIVNDVDYVVGTAE